jgi:hypothetical protein
MQFLDRHLVFHYSPFMSWYTVSNSTNQIAEQLIYGEWLYYNDLYPRAYGAERRSGTKPGGLLIPPGIIYPWGKEIISEV